jgi:AcrR family transcriptional regulator
MPIARQASRDDVLDVAARVFAERGFGETSLRQLIAESRMSPTAFYARYPSKNAVLEALVERVLSRIFLAASAAFAQARTVDDAVDRLAQVLISGLAGQKASMRLMMTEAPVVPAARRAIHAAYASLAKLVAAYLAQQDVANPDAFGWSAVGTIWVQIARWAVFEEIDDRELSIQLRHATALLRTATPSSPKT